MFIIIDAFVYTGLCYFVLFFRLLSDDVHLKRSCSDKEQVDQSPSTTRCVRESKKGLLWLVILVVRLLGARLILLTPFPLLPL
jgi:hypothetical protein